MEWSLSQDQLFDVTQGDILNVNIINHPNNTLIHSLDHHASTISAVPNFGPINVSDSKQYTFVASQPGVFKYHCEGNAVFGNGPTRIPRNGWYCDC